MLKDSGEFSLDDIKKKNIPALVKVILCGGCKAPPFKLAIDVKLEVLRYVQHNYNIAFYYIIIKSKELWPESLIYLCDIY